MSKQQDTTHNSNSFPTIIMKVFIILSLLALALAQQYDSENDDFDVEALTKDENAMKAFVSCFVDADSCDPVAAAFKKDLGEAVQQACAKCTPAQKHIFRRFLEDLKKNLPQEYQTLQNKFDADKKYFAPLEAAIANA